jgi:S1-C subfamily serine protease
MTKIPGMSASVRLGLAATTIFGYTLLAHTEVALAKPLSTGSGFFINEEGFFVTNFHVVVYDDENDETHYCDSLTLVLGDKNITARIVGTAPYQDLALLQASRTGHDQSREVSRPSPDVKKRNWRNVVEATSGKNDSARMNRPTQNRASKSYVAFSDNRPQKGEAVAAIGFPFDGVLSADLKISTGIVSSLSGIASDVTTFQHSAPINPGNSGGPLLNQQGYVVGVNNSRLNIEDQQNTNFAIHSHIVMDFLTSEGAGFSKASSTGEVGFVEIAKLAELFTAKVICSDNE